MSETPSRPILSDAARNRLIESRLTPNAISMVGLLGCTAAVVFIMLGWWVAAGFAFVFGSVMDLLDGKYSRMSGKADSLKTIFFALGANFAIFVAKLAAAIATGSGAMMAEAVHSLADCGNQGLLLLGMRSAKAPATPEHPLGQGKAIYFWSFLVALMLFSVGGAFSLYVGVHKLGHPEPLSNSSTDANSGSPETTST